MRNVITLTVTNHQIGFQILDYIIDRFEIHSFYDLQIFAFVTCNAGIDNIIKQYHPEVIGIASACLSETIGEDIPGLIFEYKTINCDRPLPVLVHVSTPSYQGTHIDGFHETVLATVASFAVDDQNLIHGDHRHDCVPGEVRLARAGQTDDGMVRAIVGYPGLVDHGLDL